MIEENKTTMVVIRSQSRSPWSTCC